MKIDYELIAYIVIANGLTISIVSASFLAFGQYLCYKETRTIEKRHCS